MNDTATQEKRDAKPTQQAKNAPHGSQRSNANQGDRHGGRGRGRRSRRERTPRQRSEFDNKILGIRRVTRVVAGGRRFSFSVTIVLGNGKGQVGVGLGKASDTALAIEKATNDAKKHLIKLPLTHDASIPHEIQAKYDASEVLLIPTPGKGLKAGSAVRTVLELAGVKHISGKILTRSKNPLNNARATVAALKKLKPVAHKMAARSENKAGSTKATAEKTKKKDSDSPAPKTSAKQGEATIK